MLLVAFVFVNVTFVRKHKNENDALAIGLELIKLLLRFMEKEYPNHITLMNSFQLTHYPRYSGVD